MKKENNIEDKIEELVEKKVQEKLQKERSQKENGKNKDAKTSRKQKIQEIQNKLRKRNGSSSTGQPDNSRRKFMKTLGLGTAGAAGLALTSKAAALDLSANEISDLDQINGQDIEEFQDGEFSGDTLESGEAKLEVLNDGPVEIENSGLVLTETGTTIDLSGNQITDLNDGLSMTAVEELEIYVAEEGETPQQIIDAEFDKVEVNTDLEVPNNDENVLTLPSYNSVSDLPDQGEKPGGSIVYVEDEDQLYLLSSNPGWDAVEGGGGESIDEQNIVAIHEADAVSKKPRRFSETWENVEDTNPDASERIHVTAVSDNDGDFESDGFVGGSNVIHVEEGKALELFFYNDDGNPRELTLSDFEEHSLVIDPGESDTFTFDTSEHDLEPGDTVPWEDEFSPASPQSVVFDITISAENNTWESDDFTDNNEFRVEEDNTIEITVVNNEEEDPRQFALGPNEEITTDQLFTDAEPTEETITLDLEDGVFSDLSAGDTIPFNDISPADIDAPGEVVITSKNHGEIKIVENLEPPLVDFGHDELVLDDVGENEIYLEIESTNSGNKLDFDDEGERAELEFEVRRQAGDVQYHERLHIDEDEEGTESATIDLETGDQIGKLVLKNVELEGEATNKIEFSAFITSSILDFVDFPQEATDTERQFYYRNMDVIIESGNVANLLNHPITREEILNNETALEKLTNSETAMNTVLGNPTLTEQVFKADPETVLQNVSEEQIEIAFDVSGESLLNSEELVETVATSPELISNSPSAMSLITSDERVRRDIESISERPLRIFRAGRESIDDNWSIADYQLANSYSGFYNVGTGNEAGICFSPSGGKVFLGDWSSSLWDVWELNEGYEIGTRSHVDTVGVTTDDNVGLTFSNDGLTAFYAYRSSTARVYNLDEPFVISGSDMDSDDPAYTITPESPFSQSSITGIHFNPDGTRAYIDFQSEGMLQFDLDDPFDLTESNRELTGEVEFGDSSRQGGGAYGACKILGKFVVIEDDDWDRLHQYRLDDPWDITSIDWDSQISVRYSDLGFERFVGGLAFSRDGKKMFVFDYDSEDLFVLERSESWYE